MRRTNHQYSRAFKLKAVRRCAEPGQSMAQVADELSVSVSNLYRWRAQYAAGGEVETSDQ